MNNTVSEIEGVACVVNNGAGEIAAGNLDLSNRTEQQASSLEETASSMEEVTSQVQFNSDNATQANSLVKEVNKKALDSGQVVNQAVESMGELNRSSLEIKGIIGVINDIAFQTNLLALNASVEAARAGEMGRGFAVVASEVRNLAGRSAEAAKSIKELIEDSSAKVEISTRYVHDTGVSLKEIVERMQEASSLVEQIEFSSKEQSEGASLINKALSHMDKLTQQNAALVEEAAAASQNLREQSTEMTNVISVFKTAPQEGDTLQKNVYLRSA